MTKRGVPANTVRPLWLAGESRVGNERIEVTDKFTGASAGAVARADAAMVAAAIDAAVAARDSMTDLPAWRRRDLLAEVANRIESLRAEFADLLVIEVGKTIADAHGEITRAVDTFRTAAEEATRIAGEQLPLDVTPRAGRAQGIVRRFPVGVAGLITPFNFPLNLVAHKVAPAIAAGCPFVLKPASTTPGPALLLGRILSELELPRGAFSILPAASSDIAALIDDPRVALLSFTGSAEVGWQLRARAAKKRHVTLELGGNAACIVDEGTDIDSAAERITFGAFYQAGQSCISVQRVLAHRSIAGALRDRLVERTRALRMGDPFDETTDVGPLIDPREAERITAWIREAVARGARVLCGGRRDGAMVEPTILEGAPTDSAIHCEEVFGPVTTFETFDDFDDALNRANAGRFGLQAGVFTDSLEHALRAHERLEVGGVVIGDVPSFRIDAMPYGGARESGVGREGLRYAIAEMTEPRLLLFRR
ncbi:MAG: aldehyde dehydrogenase family protein [Planctomycetota bacterium]